MDDLRETARQIYNVCNPSNDRDAVEAFIVYKLEFGRDPTKFKKEEHTLFCTETECICITGDGDGWG